MTSLVTKYAAKKLLGRHMEKYRKKDVAGDYDPYFVMIENPKRPGKLKKVKKQIPDYIPEHDAIILAKMRQRAYWLDCSLFNLFGIRFGWSSLIGLIPAFGDVIDIAFALMLFYRCTKVECKLDRNTQSRMVLNIVFDFFLGLIPFVGDLSDAAFRANSRNVRLLEQRLDDVYKPDKERKGKPRPPATVYEDFSDEEEARNTPMSKDNRHVRSAEPSRPQPARVPTETRGGETARDNTGRGWFAGSKHVRRSDIEMGR